MHPQAQHALKLGMGAAGASQAIYDSSGFQNVATTQQLMYY